MAVPSKHPSSPKVDLKMNRRGVLLTSYLLALVLRSAGSPRLSLMAVRKLVLMPSFTFNPRRLRATYIRL